MKRFSLIITLLMVALIMSSFVAPVLAVTIQDTEQSGSWFSVIFTWANIWKILTVVFGIVIAAAASKYKKLLESVAIIVQTYAEAKDPGSPGGKALTKDEKSLLFSKILTALKETLNVFSGGLFGWLGNIFKKK